VIKTRGSGSGFSFFFFFFFCDPDRPELISFCWNWHKSQTLELVFLLNLDPKRELVIKHNILELQKRGRFLNVGKLILFLTNRLNLKVEY